MKVLPLIKKLADELDLTFNKGDYTYMKVKPQEYLLSIYLIGCPSPEMIKIGGKTIKERATSLKEYVKSENYKKSIKGRGGTVFTKKEVNKLLKATKIVKDDKLTKLAEKLREKIKDTGYIVIVIDEESLIHEFTHVLMNNNNLDLSSVDWKWNEGLVTYLEHNIQGKELEQTNDSMNKIYYDYAKKWESLLKKAKTPKERKELIKEQCKKIKASSLKNN